MGQNRQTPGDYMSSDPAQQRVGDTQAGQEALASYEDGGDQGDIDGMSEMGRKGGSTRSAVDERTMGSGMGIGRSHHIPGSEDDDLGSVTSDDESMTA